MSRILGSTKKSANNPLGFTMVEIAIVLVIVGIILGTLAPMMIAMIKKDKLKSGRQVVERAKDEIIGYAMIHNGKLPTSVNDLPHNVDPWGNRLFLIISPDLAINDVCSVNSTIMSAVFYSPSSSGSCTTGNVVSNIACLVASKGPDYNRQISALLSNQVGILGYGCMGDLYPADNGGLTSNRPFDDIYEYLSLAELKARVCQPSTNSTSSGP
ncbi:MAG: prepilin-type N-terminal cleavage/methylation domain-containing protein [Thermodesulfobacteria bacterium]|nr:prepilin-type N-terminal cleavage/methylation domain-containing protein [Thermodesulfobacteriota bacterium]